VTKDGFVVMASEVGVLEIEPSNIVVKERLHPGRSSSSTSSRDGSSATRRSSGATSRAGPYRDWVERNRVVLGDLPAAEVPSELRNREQLFTLQQAFGYTMEDLKVLIAPMAVSGKWAIGSMGEDAALACLSDRPQLPLPLFQAALRPGLEPGDGLDQRAAR
jgi:Asp-tRNA(Asn)/Glu-tRNA(Gln) amidotransferase A subunit family amidase